VGEGEELFRDSGWLPRLEEAGLSNRAGTCAARLLSGTDFGSWASLKVTCFGPEAIFGSGAVFGPGPVLKVVVLQVGVLQIGMLQVVMLQVVVLHVLRPVGGPSQGIYNQAVRSRANYEKEQGG
jgi:hypothetical protein